MPTRLFLLRTDNPGYLFRSVDPPLGILSLSASVKKAFPSEVEVRVKDVRLRGQNEKTLSRELLQWQPDVVGFSSLSPEAARTAHLVRLVKTLLPRATVLVGGPYASMMPGECLEETGAEFAFRGEGERTLVKWLAGYREGHPPRDLPGLARREGAEPPFPTSPPEIIEDLNLLPMPDWGAIRFDDYYFGISMNWFNAHRRYTSITTSRGCPFHCAYCHHLFGRKVRFRDLNLVLEEIALLYHRYGIREFQIVDDIFNVQASRVLDFCRLIRESGMKLYLSFPNGLRGDLLTREVIDALQGAGAYMMTFAIESASDRIQKLIRKNLDLPRTYEMIRYADSRGIITKAFVMLGFVTETEQEIRQTIETVLDLPLLQVSFFTVVPQVNTELFAITKGIDKDFELGSRAQYWGHSPTYTNRSGHDLPKVQRRAYLRFYFCSTRLLRLLWRFPRRLHLLKCFLLTGVEGLVRIK